jgi:hypothetical protein
MEVARYLPVVLLHMLISMALASQEIDCRDTAQHHKPRDSFIYWDLWLVLGFFTVLSSACVCIMNARSYSRKSGLDDDSGAILSQDLGCIDDPRETVRHRGQARRGIQVPLLEQQLSRADNTTTTHSLKQYVACMLSKLSTSRERESGELRVGEASVSKLELTL